MTDVKLDQGSAGDWIELEARAVKIDGSDLLIDAADRRAGGATYRRALVHDAGDKLTLNFANDYSGGLQLNGVVEITPLRTPHAAPSHLPPALTIRGRISYEMPGRALAANLPTPAVTVFVDEQFDRLQAQIDQLTAKVAALEAKK